MVLYRRDVLLAPADPVAEEAEIDRVNALLEAEGIREALIKDRRAPSGDLTVIPTRVDAAVIRDALRNIRLRGEQVQRYGLNYQSVPGTAGTVARSGNLDYYVAAGCRTGHGTAAWLPAPEYKMPPRPAWEGVFGERRPVIALLDSGVEDHEWLPRTDPDDPFVMEQWNGKEPVEFTNDRAYRGHGTFNAAIIRFTAPKARVLPMRVMADDGRIDDTKVVEALTWLADQRAKGEAVDVICMPFGRYQDEDEDDDLAAIKVALSRLKGVPVIASAGNDGVEKPVFPAAFATDPDTSVVSVGSRESPTERAKYSNFGIWVKAWRGGTNTLSAMPMQENGEDGPKDGYAWWSGTSFAAVRYAAEVARDCTVS